MNIARTLLTLCVVAAFAAGAAASPRAGGGDAHGYYADDSLASVTYPSGRKLTTCYDALTTTDCTSLPAVPAAAGSYYASMAQYAPHGSLKSLRYGNGLFEGATFNSRQQPEGLTLGASENAFDRWRQRYDFRPGGDATKNNGNVRKLTLTLPGRSPFDTHFNYDALNRLAGVLENPAVPLSGCVAGNTKWCQQFSYDEMGNRAVVAEQGLGAQLGRPASFAKSNNRTTDPGWGYDARGNVNAIPFPPGTDKFLYDAENRLVTHCSYAGPAETCTTDDVAAYRTVYRYDAEGRRVKREQPGQVTVFAYDAFGNLAAEYGTVAPAAAGRSYLTTDHLGSTRVISDESGAVRERHDYQPFGLELIFSSPDNPRVGVAGYGVDAATPLKFTGKERDAETGLDCFGARYFSGAQGRFTSPDRPFADQTPLDPQSWNLYSYTRNNPLKYVDRTGEAIETAWDALNVGIGAVSFVSNVRQGNYFSAAVDAVGVVIDAAATVAPFVPGGAGTLIKAGRLAGKADDVLDAAQGLNRLDGAADAAGTAKRGPSFLVSEGGDVIPVPSGASGPSPVVNPQGKTTGFAFTGGKGGQGLHPNVSDVRVMDPTSKQPNGYVVFQNAAMPTPQGVNPQTGRTVPHTDPSRHIPLSPKRQPGCSAGGSDCQP